MITTLLLLALSSQHNVIIGGGGGGGFASPATASLDMDGQDIVLDLDADTYLRLNVDDVIDIYVGGALEWTFDASSLNARGNRIYDSTDELNLGTAAEAGSATGTGNVVVGGALEVDGMLYADGAINVGAGGVRLTGDGDGAITLLSLGNGSLEDITLNLDDTSNTLSLSSSTGLVTLNTGGIRITDSTDELNLGTSVEALNATSVGDVVVGGNFEVRGSNTWLPTTGALRWDGRGQFSSPSGSIIRCGDGASLVCGIQSTKPIIQKTTGYSVSSLESNSIYSNTGTTVRVDFTLPTASVGQCWHFAVNDADGIKIIAPASHVIYDGGSASASAGYMCSTTRGSTVEVCAIENSTTFMTMGAKSGTWTVDSGC